MERFYELDDGDSPVTKKSYQLTKSHLRGKHDDYSSSDSISDEEIIEASKLLSTSASHNLERSDYDCSESKYQEEACTWSMALKNVKELACLQAEPYAGHLSDRRKRSRGRDKPKFSIRSNLHHEVDKNKMLSGLTSDDLEEENIIDDKSAEASVTTLAGCPQRDSIELPLNLECQDLGAAALPSVAKLLEDLQERDGSTYGHLNLDAKSNKPKNVCFWPRNTSHSGTRTMDDEDPLEFAGAEISSEDEGYHTNQLSSANVKNNQSMSGKFQEVFNNCSYFRAETSFTTSRQIGIGYYGRLQEIIQNEKDANLNFLKLLQTKKNHTDDVSCLTVRILSRHLEAKLTVCHCLLDENIKSFEEKNKKEKCYDALDTLKRTVIFSPWMYCDVELEVGNFICIHPPWKEVLVDNGDIVILSSYFTQIFPD